MAFEYTSQFCVSQPECDPWDRMTPGAVLRQVQEISTAHAEALGMDEALYRNTNTVFMLSRLSLAIHRLPACKEQVSIATRARGMQRAVYNRATELKAADGSLLCEADSRWVLVDATTHRILRKEPEGFSYPYSDDAEKPLPQHEMTMPKEGALLPLGELCAAYTLCDRNGHLNNTRYADIVCDKLPLALLAKAPPRRMLLHYRAEIPLGGSFSLQGIEFAPGAFRFAALYENNTSFEAFVQM